MTISRLPENLERKLTKLGTSLIDQQKARVLVEPTQDAPGYWFGGGNMVHDPNDGSLLLIGRYRDEGDSRSGLTKGTRGRELAIFRSLDKGRTFAKIRSWDKSDLYCGSTVISIEGSCLRLNKRRVEIMVSTEKVRTYPRGLAPHQKPGTGVWSIDTFAASSLERLDPQDTIQPLLSSTEPAYLHLKDPNISPGFQRGQYLLLYCAHPYSWSSSTSGYAVLKGGDCLDQSPDLFPRGPAWDVAATRITCRLPLPRLGAFADQPPLSLYFYDGAECLRPHQSHRNAVERPRGYSCEELGGLAYGFDRDFPRLHRLSLLQPLFVSPHGTGCSRYATVTADSDGSLFALWERSSPNQGQPLVGHRLSAGRTASILA